ncbi:hypothetical protein [Streptomyces poriticola]|uniref:hypothetical protein n=1 Tax=Streptomyces poriticola TaxID=3120506 RepID=UPI0038CD8EC8
MPAGPGQAAGAAARAGPGVVDPPVVRVSRAQAGAGGSVTVSGRGWRARALLTLVICGQSDPVRGVAGGSDSCANADGRTVTTDDEGGFRRELPVVEPPVPCPCVVHAATATGPRAEADATLRVAGHAVEPLPADGAGGRLSLLAEARLEGSDDLLTWFGAAPTRTLVLTVGNAGTSPVRDPVFRLGTSHGVYAPRWQDLPWRGTVRAGGTARIELPVELAAGAHGDYTVSLKYGGRVLVEHPWDVGRPWGLTLFWLLTALVVPTALYRAALAAVDHLRLRRPRTAAADGPRPGTPAAPTPHRRRAARVRAPRAARPSADPSARR